MLQENEDVWMLQGQINTVHSGAVRNEKNNIIINMYREVKRTAEKKME